MELYKEQQQSNKNSHKTFQQRERRINLLISISPFLLFFTSMLQTEREHDLMYCENEVHEMYREIIQYGNSIT